MKRLVIFGTGNLATISHYYFTHDSPYSVVGFAVDAAYLRDPFHLGLPVVPFEDVERHFPPDAYDMFVAAGIRELNQFRARKVREAEAKGYKLVTYISSRAVVPQGLVIGSNSMVLKGTCVLPFAVIGQNVVIFPNSEIAYWNHIADHCWLAVTTTGEQVSIGEYTFVGVGSRIAPNVKIGRANMIGAGSLILHDTPDDAVYYAPETSRSKVPSGRAARLLT